MATKVLDLELTDLPEKLENLDPYSHIFVLCRLYGQPVGQAWLPVINGQIVGRELKRVLLEAAGRPLWERHLHNWLKWEQSDSVQTPRPSATVAVCTRNRPHDLQRCLTALLALPDDGQEYVVIDSCSSMDEVRHVAEQFARVRYIREERPGLNIARNRALQEASYEIVAFCDDDAVPDPNWLRALLRNFDDPLVFCATGLTMPLELETDAQEWFERYTSFGRGFRQTKFDRSILPPAAANRCGAGVNMALRRIVMQEVGYFDEALDSGTITCSGGDTEMFARLLAAGYKIAYDPAALNWHRHRQSWDELLKTVYGYGVGVYAAWMRHLWMNHGVSVFVVAANWLFLHQLPMLAKSLLHRPNSVPIALIWHELRGCFDGPSAYLRSRNRIPKKVSV